jgi:Protein of unknown function (DUF2924)
VSGDHPVAEEVRALARLDLEGLREAWRLRFGPPPALRSPDLLRRLLAWRIQAAALGGLDAETRRLLRQSGAPRGPSLCSGTRLAREWKGVRHEVEVTEHGFRYGEGDYDSLSEIARRITGSRWNGPRFFGLRQGDGA